jgi:hypothetical protein
VPKVALRLVSQPEDLLALKEHFRGVQKRSTLPRFCIWMPVETCGQNPTQNGDFRPLKRSEKCCDMSSLFFNVTNILDLVAG